MRIFVAKSNFLSHRGQVMEGTLFVLESYHSLPQPATHYLYEHHEDWQRFFTELDMVLKTSKEPENELEFNGDYAPKRKKKVKSK